MSVKNVFGRFRFHFSDGDAVSLQVLPLTKGVGASTGLAAAVTSAKRGHDVVIYDASSEIGGQFNIAKQIPGKEEFYETLRYFKRQIELHKNITLKLNTYVDAAALNDEGFDEVMIATGIKPRTPAIEGIEHEKVLTYIEVLKEKKTGPNHSLYFLKKINIRHCTAIS